MAIERVEGTPFIVAGNICDWDEKLKNGLTFQEDEFSQLQESLKGKKEGKENGWEAESVIYNKMVEKVVEELKKCDQNLVNQWNRIYHHSLSLQGVNKQLGDTKVVVGQQAIGLAAGVPAAAGVGAIACPLFKLCMRFFSK